MSVRTYSFAPATATIHWDSNNKLPLPRWLVKNLLPETGVALLSGRTSTGKTFMALHMAYCIATGQDFAGQKVKRPGGTLFFAAEAAGDIWYRLYGAKQGSKTPLPFAWIDAVPLLSAPDAIQHLKAYSQQATTHLQSNFNVPLALIVIDTLSAAAGFEDENSATDTQPVMNMLHELARKTGALVLVIDHFGKSKYAGTRGSTAKESSADTVLTLTALKKNAHTVMSVRKQRNGKVGDVFGYFLKPVSVGRDADGEEITTCIVTFNSGLVIFGNDDLWKNAKDLKQALETTLAREKKTVAPSGAGGSTIEAARFEAVRVEFYKIYPAKGVDAKRKAFNRQIKSACDADAISTHDVSDEKFISIVAN